MPTSSTNGTFVSDVAAISAVAATGTKGALVGKVFCKVGARPGPVKVGDLLTTSPPPGHAMKASDRDRAFGGVIGKALQPLTSGRGLIAVLVALQ